MRRLSSFILLSFALPMAADEGTWLFNQFPADAVKQKYNFDVTSQFLDNLRFASVRIAGGSGTFVSPAGLLITNQHLITGCLAGMSGKQQDYVKDGFYAPSQPSEKPCPGIEASVLASMEDVTKQIKAAAKDGAPAAQALQQRNAVITRVEQECSAKIHDKCSVVTLYSGGRYDLYEYKTYTD